MLPWTRPSGFNYHFRVRTWSRHLLLRWGSLAIAVELLVCATARGAQEESRGWGSSWTVPHTPAEKANRELEQRLQKTLRVEDWAEADKALAEASQRNPKSAYIPYVRSMVAMYRRRYDDALSDSDRALALLAKGSSQAKSAIYVVRSYVHQLKGDYRAGRDDLGRALALNRANLAAQNGYAWVLATCPDNSLRDGRKAVKFAAAVNKKTEGKIAGILDTLAAAEAEVGDFRAAVRDEQRALIVDKGEKRDVLQKHLQVFQNGQPLHIPAEAPQPMHLTATKN